jgi:hypothetical protein
MLVNMYCLFPKWIALCTCISKYTLFWSLQKSIVCYEHTANSKNSRDSLLYPAVRFRRCHSEGVAMGDKLPLSIECFSRCASLTALEVWLIDYLRFYVPLKNFSLIWKRHHCRRRASISRSMLRTQGLWAGRDLYRATPTVTRGLGFSGTSDRKPHLVASYNTQGGVEDLF